jgi:hypothetical protein
MSKLHIIGVGGTGHKIMGALIHLTACGAFKGKLGQAEIKGIRALTIDADDSNGNLSQTKNILSAYRRYYDALSGAGALGLVNIEPISDDVNIPLFKEDKKSISRTFNIPQYAGSDDDVFIRFLYTKNEIDAEFDQGFYGHTSIGTLVVKDILKSSDVWAEQLSKINDNDFVVVAGSIFGGTGASAIPVLLDELSARKKETEFKFAALMLNPYFAAVGKIQDDSLLQPDSSNFNIKAKASLYYYYRQEQYKKTDALYIIGEPESNFSFETAARGASNQRNKAHPIELFAATAIIDFIRETDDRKGGNIITAERSEKDGAYCYTWNMLQNILPDLPVNIQKTVKTAVFYNKVLYRELGENKQAAGVWKNLYSDLDSRRDDKQNYVYENIHTYLNMLVGWFYDIQKRNKRETDQNKGTLAWEPDTRVKLFNAQYSNLFDDVPVESTIIENFSDLIYRDNNGKKSEKLYALTCGKPPASGADKSFGALFTNLYSFVSEPEKKLFFFAEKPPAPENFVMVPYLSRENDVVFAKPDAVAGKLWAKSQPTLLVNIADGLPIGVSENFTKDDISIPSPWSIFIMNELTLTEPKFSAINKGAYKEWCGIIALLALRKINLYENQGLKLEVLNLGGGDGEFLRVVNSTLIPQSFIFDNHIWIKCHRVTLDGVTIAFLANNTLVCPVYSLDNITKGKLNKIAPTIVDEAGNFLSPDNYFKDQSQTINRDAKYALKLFLTELKAIITREAGKDKFGIIRSLQDLTDKYLEAISSVTPNNNLSIAPEKKDAVHSVAALFEELCIAPGRSNIELPFIMEGAKTRAALIGLNICGINSNSPDAVHHRITENIVYSQMSAVNIGEYKNTTRDGIKLIYADDLLCDSMLMIKKDGGSVIHTMPNPSSMSEYEIIWPLSDMLLSLYQPETLNRMVSLSSDNEKITVSLKIKLSGKLGTHNVSREYRIKNRSDMQEDNTQLYGICCLMERNLIPFWSLWPYTKINDTMGNNTWQRYSCFCVEPNYRGIPVLDLKPVFESEGNYLAGEQKLSTLQTVLHEFYYRRYTTLPAAFKVNEKTEGVPIYRGLVFLANPKEVNAGAVSWNVGIDFGTTSTTAFYTSSNTTPKFIQLMTEYQWMEGNSEPRKSDFTNDLTRLCDNGDKSSEIYFLDSQCFGQNGYATALEVMDTSSSSAEATIFTEKRVFWHNYENFRIMNTQEGRKERLLTNIKWENEKSNSAKYLNQLLTQIVYHAAAKGVRNINLFFSYPTAFGPGAKDDFCGRISSIIKNLSAETGIVLTFNEKENLLTESIAAAYYFNYRNPRDMLFFCVDIGGGSTDASIWLKAKHLFQTSIHYASRDMFIRPLSRLVKIPSVLKAVTTENNTDGIYTMLSDVSREIKMTDDKFKFLIETVLFEYYDPLITRLQDLKGQDQEAFRVFRHCVLITYSGLVYYLANIIASLFTIDDEDRKIDNDINQVIMGLSGKGSKLTNWIKTYCDFIYTEAENLIKEKTSLPIKIIAEFSPETAKTETAIGMICNLDGDGRHKNHTTIKKPDVYMGCGITVSKGSEIRRLKSADFVDAYNDQFFSSPRELKIEIDKDMPELDAFISFFNKITAKTGNEMPPIDIGDYNASKNTLWNKIRQEFENALQNGRFEPPFILMLRVFLEEYAEEYLWKKIN